MGDEFKTGGLTKPKSPSLMNELCASIARSTMLVRALLAVLSFAFLLSPAFAASDVVNVRFGILRQVGDDYVIARETTRIPRRLKDTGFRFGISFENPQRADIQWYEVVRLPKELAETSGTLRRLAPRILKTDVQQSNQPAVVEHFWFDQGDPLGKHRLELFVNGTMQFSVEFEVVQP